MSKLMYFIAQLPSSEVDLPQNQLAPATIDNIRNLALVIFGAVALIIMAYAGFKYITSQGNPDETAKAQKTIIFTIVGLVVASFTVSIISFVINRL